jgi:hypothetical protein
LIEIVHPVYTFAEHALAGVRDLVRQYHYSHREKSCPLVCGGLLISGLNYPPRLIAGCIFTPSMGKWAVPVAELQRLVRHPDFTPPLTMLISKTVKLLKRRPDCPAIAVSYADSTQGHHGGVYQAASWNYALKRDVSNDGIIINGDFIPGRSCNAKFGTRSADQLQALHPDWVIEKHWDLGKYLYWIPLTKRGERTAFTLGLEKRPYPKPTAVKVTPATRLSHQIEKDGSTPISPLMENNR